MKRLCLWLVLLLTQTNLATSASPSLERQTRPMIEDFAVRQPLLIEGNAAAYRFTIPLDLYQSLAPGGIGYMSIFNEQGHLVPWKLSKTNFVQNITTEVIPLGFFNGFQKQQTSPSRDNLSVYQDSDSLSINLDINPAFNRFPVDVASAAKPNIYYVDLKDIPQRRNLGRLDFQWADQAAQSFTFNVDVSASDDFRHWTSLGQGRLVDLQRDSKSLKIRRLNITPPDGDYLRIQFSGQEVVPPLESLVGFFNIQEEVSPTIGWQPVALSKLPEETGYSFTLDGEFLLAKLKIVSAVPNSSGEAFVYRWHRKQWQLVKRTRISQFEHEDLKQHDNWIDVSIPHAYKGNLTESPARSRKWKLVFSPDSTDYLQTAPQVSIAHTPEDITFLRQGQKQFVLAFNPPDSLRRFRQWPTWQTASTFPGADFQSHEVNLGQKSSHTPTEIREQQELLTTSRIFWLGMGLFLVVLVIIALHLLKELRNKAD